jgi:hypothetical protein
MEEARWFEQLPRQAVTTEHVADILRLHATEKRIWNGRLREDKPSVVNDA